MILTGDQYTPRVQIDDWMVRAVVPKLHLDRARTAGQR